MALTDEQVQKYLANDGAECPFCGSDQIEGSSIEINAGNAYQQIFCNTCNKGWTDEYTLSHVEENV